MSTEVTSRPRPGRRAGWIAVPLAVPIVLGALGGLGVSAAHADTPSPQPQLTAGVTSDAPVALTAGTGAATTSAPAKPKPVAVPAMPSRLPEGIEATATLVAQVSCSPVSRPGTKALAGLLSRTYPGSRLVLATGCGGDGESSEHYDGRGLDWVNSASVAGQRARVDALLRWLLAADSSGRGYAAARRLGVMYVIWNGRIWTASSAMSGWQAYPGCAGHREARWNAYCHRDRVHFGLSWAGATGRTSFWSGRVAGADFGPCRPRDLSWAPAYSGPNPSPCPRYPALSTARLTTGDAELIRFSGATVGLGYTGPAVAAVQRALGIDADGRFGPQTQAAVRGFQTAHELTVTGSTDADTWRALLADRSLQATAVSSTSTGSAKSPTPHAAPGGTKSTPAPVTNPLTRYKGLVLRYGARGAAVNALQKALGIPVTGWFGPVTKAAVIGFQKGHRLPSTGVVTTPTWVALGA